MKLRKLVALVLAALLCLTGLTAFAEEMTEEDYKARIAELEAQVADLEHQLAAKNYVAEFDGGFVTVEDAMKQYEYISYMYSSYGYSMDGYEDVIKQDLAANLVNAAVEQYKAKELGLDALTEEKTAELQQQAAETMNGYVSNYRSQFESEELSEEEIVEKTMAFLNENGVTEESVIRQLSEQVAAEQLFENVTKDIDVTDAELQDIYGQNVLNDMNTYADSYAYESAVRAGTTIYWRPEGYRNVKQVLVAFNDDQKTAYTELTGKIKDLEAELDAILNPAEETAEATEAPAEETEAAKETAPRTEEEVRADLDQANADLDALYAELQPTVDEVIAKFNDGMSMDKLIATYGGDPGSINADGTTNTYLVSAASTAYDPAFTEAAMSVEEIGGLSEPSRGMYGFYLVYYDSDAEAGQTDFEAIRDELYSLTLEKARSDAYNEQLVAWCEELNVTYYLENFR